MRVVLGTFLIICFFFNDTATTEIYTLSLHDALPILGNRVHPSLSRRGPVQGQATAHQGLPNGGGVRRRARDRRRDRKSTRLNSSHANISYAVFCLKKKIHRTSSQHILPTFKSKIAVL